MTVVFVSNYFNHHQRPLSEALDRLTDGNFCFIETSPMREDRRRLGYGEMEMPDYVYTSYRSDEMMAKCQQLIDEADVVIAGSAPERMLKNRIRQSKPVLRYSERPLKKGFSRSRYLPRLILWNLQSPFWKPIYMLCAGAYTASDYRLFGMYRKRCYQWGYFPEWKQYTDISGLLRQKKSGSILWAGRFLDWKHPDDALSAVRRLKEEGYSFRLKLIGMGPMEAQLKTLIGQWGLEDCVELAGAMKPEQVRACMEESEIFLFTSDRQEGWGAVVNEAMNSCCAVVASDAPGSVPYLISDGENGLIYPSGNVDILYDKIKFLLEHPARRIQLGEQAYASIANLWNANVAAERLLALAGRILEGEKHPCLFDSGPCAGA